MLHRLFQAHKITPDELHAKPQRVQSFLIASEMVVMDEEEKERKEAERRKRRKK